MYVRRTGSLTAARAAAGARAGQRGRRRRGADARRGRQRQIAAHAASIGLLPPAAVAVIRYARRPDRPAHRRAGPAAGPETEPFGPGAERWTCGWRPGPRRGRARSDEDAWCAALVERVAAGDAAALEELYDRYARPAYSLARRVTGDPAFAEEVVQEVFLAVWRQPERFQPAGVGSPGGCSRPCTTRRWTRYAGRRRSAGGRWRCRRCGLDASDAPVNRTEDVVEERLRGEQVRRALRALPDNQREALTLAYYGGYTQREIASLTAPRSAP